MFKSLNLARFHSGSTQQQQQQHKWIMFKSLNLARVFATSATLSSSHFLPTKHAIDA
jgi:hypothetical protein